MHKLRCFQPEGTRGVDLNRLAPTLGIAHYQARRAPPTPDANCSSRGQLPYACG